jgi:hypothetical protein
MLNRRRFIYQLSGGAAAFTGSSMFPPERVLGSASDSSAPVAGEWKSSI